MCNSGKNLTKTRFTSLIRNVRLATQQSSVLFAPAWHIVDCQQIYLIVLEGLGTLLESRDVVCDALSRFLWSLFEAKNISRLSPFCCGRCCPSSVSSLVIKASIPRRFLSAFCSSLSGMFRALGNSSWSVIARPTRRAAPLSPPTSRAATDQLTSRFSPVLYRRTSCW